MLLALQAHLGGARPAAGAAAGHRFGKLLAAERDDVVYYYCSCGTCSQLPLTHRQVSQLPSSNWMLR
jgi:hypothetical protein